MEWRTTRVGETVHIGVAHLQEELNVREGVVFSCQVERSFSTVEILKRRERVNQTLVWMGGYLYFNKA